MPFHRRSPVPGPCGHSPRLDAAHSHHPAPARRPATLTPQPAPAGPRTYTAQFGDWECDHQHTAERGAYRCGLRRKLEAYTELERQLQAIDLSGASPQKRQRHAEQAARLAVAKRILIAKMDAL